MADELSADPRVTAMHAAGFLESWAVRSIRAFEAAGLTVALDTGDGRESRASAWGEGYEAALDDIYTTAENAHFPQTSPNPYRARVQ